MHLQVTRVATPCGNLTWFVSAMSTPCLHAIAKTRCLEEPDVEVSNVTILVMSPHLEMHGGSAMALINI